MTLIILLPLAAGGFFLSKGLYLGALTVRELLTENRQLKECITNLTAEEQIGYAKVISQYQQDGKLYTNLKFVETARGDKLKLILEKETIIEGDVIHFDALIVKFSDKIVMDGKEKSLYLWRRIYGENTPPSQGFVIELPGKIPQRYADLLSELPDTHQQMFWENIWQLANDPEKLNEYGITAVYGNVIYSKLKPGLIYVFKISPAGQLYPEVVPDM